MITKPLTFEEWAKSRDLNPRVYGSQTSPSGSYGWARAAWNDASELYTYMLECANAAGFASITEAIAVAKVARDPWTPVSKELPPEPGWYLVMLEPDNDWGLMSDTALQVEFDAYTSKPKAFTCFYDYRGDEDITAAVLEWMPMPQGPRR